MSDSRKRDEAPGDLIRRLHKALSYAYRIESPQWSGQVDVEAIRLKLGATPGEEVLVIVTGYDEDGAPVVGFHSALGLLEAFAGALQRIGSGQMRWRPDEYRQGGSSNG